MMKNDLIDKSVNGKKETSEEQSPILGSWRNVYLLVLAVLVAVIAGLWILTETFK